MTNENTLRDMAIERRVEARLTEIFAAAGVDSSRAALELLYLMPKDFLSAYEELFEKALKLDGSSATGALKEQAELGKAKGGSSGDRGLLPMTTGGGKRHKEYWLVKDDSALELKKTLDKRLRRIAREIRADLRDVAAMARGEKVQDKIKCDRCQRIMSRDWNFCAGCGNHKPLGSLFSG